MSITPILLLLLSANHIAANHVSVSNSSSIGGEPADPTAAPPQPHQRGWRSVSAREKIPLNLIDTQLQITSRWLQNRAEINIDLNFASGDIRNVSMRMSDDLVNLVIALSGCDEVSTDIQSLSKPGAMYAWTIAKNNTHLRIGMDKTSIADIDINSENCTSGWGDAVSSIEFTASDTGSLQYRIKPDNCSAIPLDWKHIITDTIFPVPRGSAVTVRCAQGYWDIGDTSITCDTDLYSDFSYIQRIPWCVGIRGEGSEVLAGTKTTLTCALDNLPTSDTMTVQWKIDGNVTHTGVEIDQRESDALTTTITLENPTVTAMYLCQVKEFPTVRTPVQLNVFSMRDVSKDAQVGVRTVLGCFVDNITGTPYSPAVVWKLGDQVIVNSPDFRIDMKTMANSVESYLTVRRPSGDNNFTCQVQSAMFPASPASEIVVSLDTFSVSSDCTDYCMRTQESATIECSVHDTHKSMSIRWFKGDTEITGALQSFEGTVERSVLFVKTSRGGSDNQYTCQIESKHHPESGVSSHLVTVPALPMTKAVQSLTSSPVVWVLAGVLLLLTVVVAVLGVKVIRAQRNMVTLNLRLSTREKLDSVGSRPSTILRNRAAHESLRRTLRQSGPTMSEINVSDDNPFDQE